MFYCEYCEVFKSTFFHRTPLVVASGKFLVTTFDWLEQFQDWSLLGYLPYVLCKEILPLSDSNWTRTHNHLVRKRTINYLARLAKWLSVRLRIKWLWVRDQLQSLKLQISRLLRARSSLKFSQLQSMDSFWNAYVTWQENTVRFFCWYWTKNKFGALETQASHRSTSIGYFSGNAFNSIYLVIFVVKIFGNAFINNYCWSKVNKI